MDEQRLKEITALASTVLPITGAIRNAPELLREVNQALIECSALPYGRQVRRLINDLRFIQREALQSIDAADAALFDNDEGDHDLRKA